MMRLHFTCNYCDFKWDDILYSEKAIDYQVCKRCRSNTYKVKDLRVDKIDTYKPYEKTYKKIDTYVGCPPFSEEKKDDEEEEYKMPTGEIDFRDGFFLD